MFIYCNCWCVRAVEKLRILVICCSNRELHITAVRNLLVFLEAKCRVHVAVVDNNCVTPVGQVHSWLNEEIKLARKVVLFHSEESVAMAYHFVRSTMTPSVALETFITALETFSDSSIDQHKLINVYFAYTPANCVVDIKCGQTFQLMNEFDKFLASIHGRSSFDTSSLLACDEGRELLLAVENAATDSRNCATDPFLPPDRDTDSIDTQILMARIRLAADDGTSMCESG